jgi:hypothetical protein
VTGTMRLPMPFATGERTMSSRTARLSRMQRGQSMVEYTIICAVLVAAMFAPLPNDTESAAQKLCDALRQTYSALSFFFSLP